jgi:hypothetical protein
MARQRPALAVFGTDGPLLAAIVDALCDLHDLLDERLPAPSGAASGGPVRISEPAPAVPPPNTTSVSEPAPDSQPLPEPPPRAGRGSSLPAWAGWATTAGVTVTDGMSRDDIITACQTAGVLKL